VRVRPRHPLFHQIDLAHEPPMQVVIEVVHAEKLEQFVTLGVERFNVALFARGSQSVRAPVKFPVPTGFEPATS
jgi:hypothetical protein